MFLADRYIKGLYTHTELKTNCSGMSEVPTATQGLVNQILLQPRRRSELVLCNMAVTNENHIQLFQNSVSVFNKKPDGLLTKLITKNPNPRNIYHARRIIGLSESTLFQCHFLRLFLRLSTAKRNLATDHTGWPWTRHTSNSHKGELGNRVAY